MGTRSLTYIYNQAEMPLVCIYRQYDGYPSGQGADLAKLLQTANNQDVPDLIAAADSLGFSLSRKSRTARTFGTVVLVMSLALVLLAWASWGWAYTREFRPMVTPGTALTLLLVAAFALVLNCARPSLRAIIAAKPGRKNREHLEELNQVSSAYRMIDDLIEKHDSEIEEAEYRGYNEAMSSRKMSSRKKNKKKT